MSDLTIQVKLRRNSFDLDVNFSIPKQGVTALLGPSGSGKSTILRVLAGLEQPQSGRVTNGDVDWFDGASRTSLPPQRRKVGVVFQDYALFSHLNAAQNIGFGVRDRSDKKRVNYWMERLHIKEYRERYPHQLSGGQRQRVALARALVSEPDLLLLDEPFSALDLNLRQYMRDELKSVIEETRCPVVMVTHDLYDARYLADRAGVLVDGRLHCYGSTHEVFMNPLSFAAARILGWRNFLPIREYAGVCVKGAWGSVELPEEASLEAEWVAIRSEHIRINASAQKNCLSAVVDSVTDLGEVRLLKCRLADGTSVYVHCAWHKPVPAPGAAVGLHLPTQHLRVLVREPVSWRRAVPQPVDSFRDAYLQPGL